ncbi:MAG TPA: hypothetical protein VGL71_11980, partial [Urbifossiella sp.]
MMETLRFFLSRESKGSLAWFLVSIKMNGNRVENRVASQQVRMALGQLHRLIGPGAAPAIADSRLLEDFVVRRDEKAFEVLVWRHSAMILGVCNRILRDSHLAEDA